MPIEEAKLGDVAALIARQQRRARERSPVVPDALAHPAVAEALLREFLAHGYIGRVAIASDAPVGVLMGRPDGSSASLPAAGFSMAASSPDPTRLLAELYGDLAPALLERGARRHYLSHLDIPATVQAVTDLGFARMAYCAIRPVGVLPHRVPERRGVEVREGSADDLEVVARLCMVEIDYRYVSPIYSPRPTHEATMDEVIESHRRLERNGGAHLIATLDGEDVGVLTLDMTNDAPGLCPHDQPFLGETATVAHARGRGVGSALVEAAVQWAAERNHPGLTVSFQPANRTSRRFWLGAGFEPTGFWTVRTIPESYV